MSSVTIGRGGNVHAPVAAARLAWWAAAVLVGLVLLAPLGVVEIPPLLDYPNHLARMVVLANPRDPYYAAMYAPRWGIIPDIGIDLFMPALLHVWPVYAAGKLALALVLLLPLAGAVAYHRAVFRAPSFWPLAGGLVACNRLFLLGFMNFTLSLGLALFVAAIWARLREPHPWVAALAGAMGALTVFFCHLGGLVFLAILLAAHEAELLIRRRQGLAGAAARGAALLAMVFSAPAVLYLSSHLDAAGGGVAWSPPGAKALGLLGPLANYALAPDIVSASALLGFLAWCRRAGRLAVPPRTIIALSAILAAYLVCPSSAKGAAFLDARFPIMAGWLLFAGTEARFGPRGGAVVACGFAASLLARTGLVAAVWHGHAREVAELRASIAAVPAGARVMAVRPVPKYDPAFWERAPRDRVLEGMAEADFHMPALLLIERRAFWPLLFASPSQQPIAVRPAYRDDAVPVGGPPDYRALSRGPTRQELRAAPYLNGWRARFGYVLVIDADGICDLRHAMPPDLIMLNDTGYAALFKVP